MRVIGLTGGIGMGKSAADQLLRSRGVRVIDTDILARQLVEPGQVALEEIRTCFGDKVILPDGSLDRRGLAKLTFSDAGRRTELEGILHPRIRQAWRAEADRFLAQPREQGHDLLVIVIPLLFETQAEREVDAVLCVACSAETQLTRLRARGWSDEEILGRIRAQWPVERKMSASNVVLWAEGPLKILEMQIASLLARFRRG
jgi:dephospho-CoA kinase